MKFNLSEWALNNKGIVLYFMLLLGIIGAISYSKLSQSEDPPFTFKVMVVQTYWPGATAKEVSTLVTDRIEKELMTTGQYDKIMAYSRPGESMVTLLLKILSLLRKFLMFDITFGRRSMTFAMNSQVVCKAHF